MKTYLPLIVILFLFTTCSKDEKTVSYELSTSISPTEGGSVSSSSGTFKSGEKIQLTAIPAEGYTFVRWNGASSSTENPITITFNTNQNITAVFEKSDTDNDGVSDNEDQCPDTPTGETVDAQGCSGSQKDTDGDGVNDNLDQCPETSEGETVGNTGCPEVSNNSGGEISDDADNDGVADGADECPDTPLGETVDPQGCSDTQKDADGDGVSDNTDECAETPDGEPVDAQGCSESQKDADGDGVADANDKCMETPEGEDVDEQGCAKSQKDTDGDGVNDDADQCDETPESETVDAEGCSESQKDTDGDGISDDIDQCANTPVDDDVDENGCTISLATLVPDSNFEQRLINEGIDDVLDGQVLTANMTAVEDLNLIADERINDMTGFEAFTSLKSLSISSVDDNTFVFNTENYPNLTSIGADGVRINSIVVGENSNLETLTGGISLETLNVRNNNSLTSIDLEDARINSVNITGNTELTGFIDFDGTLGNVSITNNSALELISLNSREVNGLDFSNNAILETFSIRTLTDVTFPLNFSTCPNLKNISVGGNDGRFLSIDVTSNALLENLNVSDSGLTALDISNNNALTELDASTNNPLLTCIKVNQTQLNNIPSEWIIDASTEYALECPE